MDNVDKLINFRIPQYFAIKLGVSFTVRIF